MVAAVLHQRKYYRAVNTYWPYQWIVSLGLGIKQLYDANNVKLVDTAEPMAHSIGNRRLGLILLNYRTFNQVMGQINKAPRMPPTRFPADHIFWPDYSGSRQRTKSRLQCSRTGFGRKGAMFQQRRPQTKIFTDKIGERMRQDRLIKPPRAMLTEAGCGIWVTLPAATDANSEKKLLSCSYDKGEGYIKNLNFYLKRSDQLMSQLGIRSNSCMFNRPLMLEKALTMQLVIRKRDAVQKTPPTK